MSVKMVRRDVQQKRDIGVKRKRCFKLIGRQLKDDHPVWPRIIKVAGGVTDIAADADRQTGLAQAVTDQRRRR